MSAGRVLRRAAPYTLLLTRNMPACARQLVVEDPPMAEFSAADAAGAAGCGVPIGNFSPRPVAIDEA